MRPREDEQNLKGFLYKKLGELEEKVRRPSMHPNNSRSRVGKEKYKKEMSDNFQNLMKSIESQIKYPLRRIY